MRQTATAGAGSGATVAEMKVGQWAIAIGRTFDGGQPNMSSARRIRESTASGVGQFKPDKRKISPANYGGLLVDLHGRVLGVLVPMSPQEKGEMAGLEWYDSGIGFAVPAGQINRVLPCLIKGEDWPRTVGRQFKAR